VVGVPSRFTASEAEKKWGSLVREVSPTRGESPPQQEQPSPPRTPQQEQPSPPRTPQQEQPSPPRSRIVSYADGSLGYSSSTVHPASSPAPPTREMEVPAHKMELHLARYHPSPGWPHLEQDSSRDPPPRVSPAQQAWGDEPGGSMRVQELPGAEDAMAASLGAALEEEVRVLREEVGRTSLPCSILGILSIYGNN